MHTLPTTQLEQAFWITLMISGLPLGIGMLVGLLSAVFQAVTQIQEQSLSFVPKVAAVSLALYCLSPWWCGLIKQQCDRVLVQIPLVGYETHRN